MGRTEFLTATIASEPLVGKRSLQRERNGALLRVHAAVCSKMLDTADIVRDGDVTPTTGDTTSTVLDATPNDHQPLLTANV